jgi:hypothetical protein
MCALVNVIPISNALLAARLNMVRPHAVGCRLWHHGTGHVMPRGHVLTLPCRRRHSSSSVAPVTMRVNRSRAHAVCRCRQVFNLVGVIHGGKQMGEVAEQHEEEILDLTRELSRTLFSTKVRPCPGAGGDVGRRAGRERLLRLVIRMMMSLPDWWWWWWWWC